MVVAGCADLEDEMTDEQIWEIAHDYRAYPDFKTITIRGEDVVAFARAVVRAYAGSGGLRDGDGGDMPQQGREDSVAGAVALTFHAFTG